MWLGLAALLPSAFAAAASTPALPTSAESCKALAAEGEAPALGLAQKTRRALLAPRRAGGQRQALPSIAFVKTHKTGGSTMADILHRLAWKKNLTFFSPNDRGVLNWTKIQATVPAHHQFDMLAVHAIYNKELTEAYLRTKPFCMSVVREPVAREDSGWRFRASHNGVTDPGDWSSRLLAMAINRKQHSNEMSRDFGWYGGVDIRRGLPEGKDTFRNDHNEEAISDFIDRVDKGMDCVFLNEYYDEGLVLLKHMLNLNLADMFYLKAKESNYTTPVPPTEEQLKVLHEQYLTVDDRLYDHFQKRFWRQWEEYGGYDKFGAELAELKAGNEQLALDCEEPRDEAKCPEALALDGGFLREYIFRRGNPSNAP